MANESVEIRVLIVRIRAASADAFSSDCGGVFVLHQVVQCNVTFGSPPPRRKKRQGVLPEKNSKSFLAHSPFARLLTVRFNQGDTDTSLTGKTFVTVGRYFYHGKLG